jgi:hypothetical protein
MLGTSLCTEGMPMGLSVVAATLVVSFIIVRIGAAALELTGLDGPMATFQALSAYTGTGFTTKESELVVRHPQRRSILQALMVLGNAGIVAVMAGVVGTLQMTGSALEIGLRIVAVGLALYLLYALVLLPRISQWIQAQIRTRLKEYAHIEPVDFEEILEQEHGWGVFRVVLPEEVPCVGKTLAEARLRQNGITVVAIERKGQLFPAPGGGDILLAGDGLIVYAKLGELERTLGVSAVGEGAGPEGGS